MHRLHLERDAVTDKYAWRIADTGELSLVAALTLARLDLIAPDSVVVLRI